MARKHSISEAKLYKWKAKLSGTDVSDAERFRALKSKAGKLKRFLVDDMPDY